MARTLGGRTTGEDHNAPTGILEGGFKQTNSDAEGSASTSEGALVVRNGPRVTLKLLEHIRDLEFGLLNGEEEPCCRAKGRTSGLLRHVRTQSRGETKHLLDLLCGVFLAAAEHIRLGALGIAKLVYLCLYFPVNEPSE